MGKFVRFVLAFTAAEFLLILVSLLLWLILAPLYQGYRRRSQRYKQRPQGHRGGKSGKLAEDQAQADDSSSKKDEGEK
jgi:hypothetical protein